LRGYRKDGIVDAIRQAGGEIFAITSEPQSLAVNAQENWETGFEHIGDPHQEILGECSERGWLSLFVNDWREEFSNMSWVSHPKGYFQPGVLALSSAGRVLYRWRCRPNRKNIGGAVARPTALHVWSRVQSVLQQPPDTPDVPHDDDPVFDTPPVPWPMFVALLVSNGWFLGPRPFDQRPVKNTVAKRQRNAMIRLPIFAAAWIAAFTFLPLWLSVLAFAAWVAKVMPGIRMVNRTFQNVGPDEEPA